MTALTHERKWWKEATVYQIYPASFKDSNGDGMGDIPGISSKLDYIRHLGVDVIWICPFYKSPQFDVGYDIEDYQEVWEPYGTMDDVEALIKGAHARGLKVIFDLVVNHTSHLHKWFRESRKSRDNPKRDWYIWRPAKYVDGVRKEPNNWKSSFEGSVWEWDETTEEYYLHYFCPEQPDLNWENPDVRKAIYAEAVNFWLDKGIDGFRIDTVNMYSKFLDFPDAPIQDPEAKYQNATRYFSNGPRLHEFLKEMRQETFAKYDCMTVGECPSTFSYLHILPYVSTAAKELDMVFEFELVSLDHGGRFGFMPKEWKLSDWKAITAENQRLTEPQHQAWASSYLGNHDHARPVTRYGSDEPEHRAPSAKMLATYLLTLSGTTFIYQGEEIGMINCPRDWDIEKEYKDIGTINVWREVKKAASTNPDLLEQGRKGLQIYARDHARTPMQWDASPNAGWTSGPKEPWMRVMDSYAEINVAAQEGDPGSVLAHYRTLLKLRKEHRDVLVYGRFELDDPGNERTMVYLKRAGARAAVVALNFTKEPQPFRMPGSVGEGAELLLSSAEGPGPLEPDTLRPWEARIYLTESVSVGVLTNLKDGVANAVGKLVGGA